MLYFKRLLIVIVLILSITTLHAQNTTFSFKTNDVITIGHNGFYIADFNGPITEDLNNQPTTGINVFCGKPIGVATEEEGLSTTALWRIVEFKNKNGNT